jgi:2-dehydropantoate 2-reductase
MIKHVTIIGHGAIGSLWAYYLQQIGLKVSLVGRAKLTKKITLDVKQPNGKVSQATFDYFAAQLPQKNDLVLVTTKAYQVQQALAPLLDQLTDTPIVLLHNGMGCIELLQLPSSQPVLLATTSHGAFKSDADTLCHTGVGTTFIGSYQACDNQQTKMIANLLNQALPTVEYCANIERALWQKLAINCAINPLTAIHQCQNGQLAQAQYQNSIEMVCREISLITERLQLNLSYHQLRQCVDEVIGKTAKNYSSMYQDIANNRPTEIDFINGYVVSEGKRLGILTTKNEALWLEVKQLEALEG